MMTHHNSGGSSGNRELDLSKSRRWIANMKMAAFATLGPNNECVIGVHGFEARLIKLSVLVQIGRAV